MEKVSWIWEDDTGRIRGASVHIADEHGNPLCGAMPKRSNFEWCDGIDSSGKDCKSCEKKAGKGVSAIRSDCKHWQGGICDLDDYSCDWKCHSFEL